MGGAPAPRACPRCPSGPAAQRCGRITVLQDLAAAGYARASLEKVRSVLIQVLRHAERQGLVARNVAAIVPTPAAPRAEGRSLTLEQATTLLTAAQGHALEAAFVLGLTCGLQPGELLWLGW